jgi:hypothetical protein
MNWKHGRNDTANESELLDYDDYHLLGDDNHHSHRRGNLKSYMLDYAFLNLKYSAQKRRGTNTTLVHVHQSKATCIQMNTHKSVIVFLGSDFKQCISYVDWIWQLYNTDTSKLNWKQHVNMMQKPLKMAQTHLHNLKIQNVVASCFIVSTFYSCIHCRLTCSSH